jgi:hypothetical protein
VFAAADVMVLKALKKTFHCKMKHNNRAPPATGGALLCQRLLPR